MPELPEVETVRRGLLPVMEGQRIDQAQVNRPDLRFALPPNMAARLTGQVVQALRRRSKYILADLSSGETLLIHLGMSGRMLISGTQLGQFHHAHPAPEKHDHVVLTMQSGARVTFNDPRRFGAMDLMPTASWQAHKLLTDLGPEPLGNGFNEAYLAHRAGIAPMRLAGELTARQAASLVPLIRAVLSEAIDAGGSSLRDYRQADGELGYFQHTFRVYGREGQPCPACATLIVRLVQSGRSSFYCPSCQR